MDSALSARIISGHDMKKEASFSPYVIKRESFVVRFVEAER